MTSQRLFALSMVLIGVGLVLQIVALVLGALQ